MKRALMTALSIAGLALSAGSVRADGQDPKLIKVSGAGEGKAAVYATNDKPSDPCEAAFKQYLDEIESWPEDARKPTKDKLEKTVTKIAQELIKILGSTAKNLPSAPSFWTAFAKSLGGNITQIGYGIYVSIASAKIEEAGVELVSKHAARIWVLNSDMLKSNRLQCQAMTTGDKKMRQSVFIRRLGGEKFLVVQSSPVRTTMHVVKFE